MYNFIYLIYRGLSDIILISSFIFCILFTIPLNDALKSNISELKNSFQDGCNIIVEAVTAKGQTPASNSPIDIATAINNIESSKKVKVTYIYGGVSSTIILQLVLLQQLDLHLHHQMILFM